MTKSNEVLTPEIMAAASLLQACGKDFLTFSGVLRSVTDPGSLQWMRGLFLEMPGLCAGKEGKPCTNGGRKKKVLYVAV